MDEGIVMKRGNIISAPVPATEAEFVVRNHFLVVYESSDAGVSAVYVTSVKEGTGGAYAFTDDERAACRFPLHSRFDPSRMVFYPREEIAKHVRLTGGHLSGRSMARVVEAVSRIRPRPQVFRSKQLYMALAS